ncbi:hypothetical protein GWO43_06650 [candidate division KSB1 bacterium]|nr:hypothetical protein [candidate division KSB1 bacterium]NIR72547.1 hypothetical protein [candidate division KSB1 bacterium]NIS23642.1 hypothetical protein [candidate division KSB1 bacterium]NIT70566.1 hypothetical protein [candidate division KSB1 bacterium]NIU24284.1 hypothetical protein [candidate division KSB1 bacterium]
MWEIFRKIGFFIVVLIISAGIYLVFYAEKDVQQSVVETSLNLMGDKLFAMIPDGPKKSQLAELYGDFKQRAAERDVPPEQVETVAASILNVTNSTTSLTPEQAESVLRVALSAPEPLALAEGELPSIPKPSIPKTKPAEPEEWKALGERLKSMFELNEKLHAAMKEEAAKQRELAKQVRFQAKEGLRVALDSNLKAHLDEKEFKKLSKELKQLERENVLHWHKNLAEEIEHEMAQVHEEMASLQEELQQLKNEHTMKALKELESLKELRHLEHVPAVDADSIRKIVERSLKEAGISPSEPPEKKQL